ncbi:MAG: GNAT family N-acetyltransferase [Gammaproteobacteria bacterium]|nr:GNAT family N-acetyltransferase [Gammaproteobacteria bacterium]
MAELRVRALQNADRAAWERLWRAYLAFYGTTLDEGVFDVYFERLLSQDPHEFNGIVAEVDGELVGLVHFLYHRHGWSIENVCYLQDLFVDESRRGTGLGRALIEAVYKDADACGVSNVYWLTQDFNTTARQLYDRIARKTDFIKYSR